MKVEGKMLEVIESGRNIRRVIYAGMLAAVVYAIPPIINAIAALK